MIYHEGTKSIWFKYLESQKLINNLLFKTPLRMVWSGFELNFASEMNRWYLFFE